ncbi:MAG: class I SAM-dependent methyltransferase [Dongiaceae bacterium]
MNAPYRTQSAACGRVPCSTTHPDSASPWRRLSWPLLRAWRSIARESPEKRYERRILTRMARGDLTNTLGVQIRDEAGIRAMAEEWLAGLIRLGLRPHDLCVEYGCGSLWCAEPIIRHQQPGRFIGLDVTDRFYELGRQRLEGLLTEKQVGLAVISRRALRQVATLKPAFVYSHRVLHHVPRDALARFMNNVVALLNEQTILVIENAPRESHGKSLKRRYKADDIRPHLPQDWDCRQEPAGLVITHRARSAA